MNEKIKERLSKVSDINLEKISEDLQVKKGLSEREVDIFFVVGSGVNNSEAAEKLHVTEGTVKFHLTNVFRKLDIKSRSRLVLLAHGLEAL